MTSFVDRDYWMQTLIEHEPLSAGEIERLGQYSDCCLIPYNQSKSFVYALVINSSHDIQETKACAKECKQELLQLGYRVDAIQWTSSADLLESVEENIAKVQKRCSLLIICVIGSGDLSYLKGGNSERLYINAILHLFISCVPAEMPMVRAFG